jgi:hypothetical protein
LALGRWQADVGGGAGDFGLVLLAVVDLAGVGSALGIKIEGEPGWRGQPAITSVRLDLLEASRAALGL